ncbi:MAG: HTTM domain-containing protein [Sandaracinaceae bacterium]|nr:HTTM domain-containing protein [Sandaracinaceae bacterium]
MTDGWRDRLNAPKDGASLAAFRILFGVVMLGSIGRYFAYGWIDRFYVRPRMHFTYWGFDWVQPLPQPGMTVLFAALAVCAALIALGLFYRFATVAFFVGFTYVHLLDVSNYLNHYYLVSLLSLLLCVLPLHKQWSLDARLRPSLRATTLPAWMLYLVRFQIGLVYVFAGLAKLGPDWLLHGQPLGIWLHSRTDTPLIGPWLDEPMVALAMSWAGFLYDTTIVFWLSWRRSRPYAYVVVLAFHFMTNVFFQIGIFPVVMTVAALVFFEPDWPRWLVAKLRRVELAPASPSPAGRWRIGRAGMAVLAAWALFHVLAPLRSHLYGGDVLWHEQGMRWSWRVMVREKNGDVAYRVRVNGETRERVFAPNDYLTREQEIEFASQPDLVLQLAHHIVRDLEARGCHDVQIRADAWVSLNGRPSARMIDPTVDLAQVDDGVAPASWILPVPDAPPIEMRSRRQMLAAR